MPNLYKQYFVNNQNENARVINSNELLEERLAKVLELQRAAQAATESSEDGFTAGLVDENTDVIEPVDPVEQAKAEAERILEEARTKADDILNEADQNAKMLCEKAKEQGYQEGALQHQEELERLKKELTSEFREKEEELESEYRSKQEHMENDLVDVILEVFNKVFHIQFDNKKHILMYLIDDAILNIEGDKKFRIKVADSNVLFLENHRENILERVGHGIELEFIADSSMDGNDCIIETDSGVFDCSLGTQLENLIKDIRSLCS